MQRGSYKMCQQCNAKPVYEFTNKRKLCKNCYIRWFQKKFLYTIRKFSMIQKNDVILVEKHPVLIDLFELYKQKAPVKIIKSEEYSKKAISTSSDDLAYEFVNSLIKGNLTKTKNLKPVNKKIIRPLYLFLDKEILIYANLKNLKFKKASKKNKTPIFIDELEKKHPELKQAITKSYLEFLS